MPVQPQSFVQKHKNKIVNGSGLAALIGSLTISGLQYHENSALKEALFSTQSSLNIMGERYEKMSDRYEKLVLTCLDKVDRNGKPKR